MTSFDGVVIGAGHDGLTLADYITVAMVLAMAEESVPPGKDLPFKPGEP
jgi:hypothetical protein